MKPNLLIITALAGAALLGLGMWKRKSSPPTHEAPVAGGWLGVWAQAGGDALIRLRHDGRFRGDYAPDGEVVVQFTPQVTGDTVFFRAVLGGRKWSLHLTRRGESARLVGVQEIEPGQQPAPASPFTPRGRTLQIASRGSRSPRCSRRCGGS